MYTYIYIHIHLSIYLSICLSICTDISSKLLGCTKKGSPMLSSRFFESWPGAAWQFPLHLRRGAGAGGSCAVLSLLEVGWSTYHWDPVAYYHTIRSYKIL